MQRFGPRRRKMKMHSLMRKTNAATIRLWPTRRMHFYPEIQGAFLLEFAFLKLSRHFRSYTGNFAIDEEILAEEGYVDFSQYAIKRDAQLEKSLFVD